MKNIKYILLAVVLMAGFGIWYAYSEFHRKHKDLSKEKSDVEISATKLFQEFTNNETEANKSYLDKTISVRGSILSIDKDDKGLFTILLGTEVDNSYVSCELDLVHNEEASNKKVGDEVVMKGVCTGILTDVVMVRCVIEK